MQTAKRLAHMRRLYGSFFFMPWKSWRQLGSINSKNNKILKKTSKLQCIDKNEIKSQNHLGGLPIHEILATTKKNIE